LALGERYATPIAEIAASYLAVAEWEMRDGGPGEVGEGEAAQKGDWTLAAQYLEKVAGTNAPLRDKADELLRELRIREARVAAAT